MIGWLSKASHDQTANQRLCMPLVVFTPSTPDDITRNYLLSGHAPNQRGVAAPGPERDRGEGTGLDWTGLDDAASYGLEATRSRDAARSELCRGRRSHACNFLDASLVIAIGASGQAVHQNGRGRRP